MDQLASQLNKDCKTELNNMAIIQSFDLVVFGFWGYNYFKEQSKSVLLGLSFFYKKKFNKVD